MQWHFHLPCTCCSVDLSLREAHIFTNYCQVVSIFVLWTCALKCFLSIKHSHSSFHLLLCPAVGLSISSELSLILCRIQIVDKKQVLSVKCIFDILMNFSLFDIFSVYSIIFWDQSLFLTYFWGGRLSFHGKVLRVEEFENYSVWETVTSIHPSYSHVQTSVRSGHHFTASLFGLENSARPG